MVRAGFSCFEVFGETMRLGNLLLENEFVLPFGGAAGETPWGQALAAMAGLAVACILLSWYFRRGKDYN